MLASICDECAQLSHKLCLIPTPHYYGQFSLSPGEESTYIFSEFNSLNSVSVLTGFDSVIITRTTLIQYS